LYKAIGKVIEYGKFQCTTSPKLLVALSASLIDYVLDVTATADARHRQDLI